SLTLAAIKARPKKEVVFTLECSGNGGFPFLPGAIGNAKWAGTPLAAVLQKVGRKKDGVEVVFYGADEGEEPMTYIGGLGDKMGGFKAKGPLSPRMSWGGGDGPANRLCFEGKGQPPPAGERGRLRRFDARRVGRSHGTRATRV